MANRKSSTDWEMVFWLQRINTTAGEEEDRAGEGPTGKGKRRRTNERWHRKRLFPKEAK